MTQIINTLANIEDFIIPEGFSADICEFEEYISDDLPNSTMIRIPAGSKGKIIECPASFSSDEFTDIAFNACSFRLPILNLQHSGESYYAVDFGEDTELFEVPIGSEFDVVTVPYREVKSFRIHVLTDNGDAIVVSNLRALKELMPQDMLEGFKRMTLPTYEVGTLHVRAKDRQIVLSDVTNITMDSVIEFNGETHQIEKLIGNRATLASTFDGDRVLDDFNGVFSLQCPITIGYYDQDVKLPSVVLWFRSPTPDTRAVKETRKYQIFGNDVYYKDTMNLTTWGIRIDIIGGTPEMTQAIASYVRKFLERNRVWINGRKFTFEWTEGAVDTEPSNYLDIQPSVMYNINMEIKEEFLWQTLKKGRSNLRSVIPMQRI